MPTCCIKNCKSRSSGATKTKGIKFFSFPQNHILKEKWLEACHREEENLNVNSDCIEKKWTKPRTLSTEARLMLRLKTGSIPTQLLNLPNQDVNRVNRCSILESDETQPLTKNTCRTGIPTYEEIVACARNKTFINSVKEHVTSTETSTNIECSTEHSLLKWNYIDVCEPEAEIEKLQQHLREAEEKNKLLLLENKQLRKALEMKSIGNKQRADQDTVAGILHVVFIPGQVK